MKYLYVAFNTNCPKDVDDTRGASRLLYYKREETGAFINNSWRISLGGQWRVAAATGAPPRPQPSGMRAAETEAAGRPLLGGCAGVTGEVPM